MDEECQEGVDVNSGTITVQVKFVKSASNQHGLLTHA
jgi:hypothetical protein